MSGATIEKRIIGMLLVQPQRALEYPDLDRHMVDEDHQRVFRIVRDAKTSDLLVLADLMSLELLDYVRELAEPPWSFCPEMFPAYVRVLKEIEAERSYGSLVDRLRPQRRHENPFAGL